ncbi:MAG: hypothetical protein ACRBDL_11430 [Alphaproteobacteria bacterium]
MIDADTSLDDNLADLQTQLNSPGYEIVAQAPAGRPEIDLDNPVLIVAKDGTLQQFNDANAEDAGFTQSSIDFENGILLAQAGPVQGVYAHTPGRSNAPDQRAAYIKFTPHSPISNESDTVTLPGDIDLRNSDITVHNGIAHFDIPGHPNLALDMSHNHSQLDQDDRRNGYGQRRQTNGFNRMVLSSWDNEDGTQDITVNVLSRHDHNGKHAGHIAYRKNGLDAGSVQGDNFHGYGRSHTYSHQPQRHMSYSRAHFNNMQYRIMDILDHSAHHSYGSVHWRRGHQHRGHGHHRGHRNHRGHGGHHRGHGHGHDAVDDIIHIYDIYQRNKHHKKHHKRHNRRHDRHHGHGNGHRHKHGSVDMGSKFEGLAALPEELNEKKAPLAVAVAEATSATRVDKGNAKHETHLAFNDEVLHDVEDHDIDAAYEIDGDHEHTSENDHSIA